MSLRNRTAERRGRQNAWQTWRSYYLRVLSGIHLTLMFFLFFVFFFCSSTKRSVWRNVKFGRRFFQTNLFSRLPNKVCRRLSSLSSPFTLDVQVCCWSIFFWCPQQQSQNSLRKLTRRSFLRVSKVANANVANSNDSFRVELSCYTGFWIPSISEVWMLDIFPSVLLFVW